MLELRWKSRTKKVEILEIKSQPKIQLKLAAKPSVLYLHLVNTNDKQFRLAQISLMFVNNDYDKVYRNDWLTDWLADWLVDWLIDNIPVTMAL